MTDLPDLTDLTDLRIDDPRIAALTAPLPDDHPDPAAFRYDPVYDALETEIRRLERDGPAAVPWPAVARDAQAILATRSRDLGVLVWYVLALAQTEGLTGTAVGLAVLRAQVEQAWDTLYPPVARARQRAGAFEWLIPRLGRTLPEAEAPREADPAVLSAAADAEALEALLATRLPSPPGWRDVTRPLQRLADAARTAAAARMAAAAPPPPSPAAPPTTPLAAPGTAAPAQAPPASPPAIAIPAIDVPTDAGGDMERSIGALREAVRTAALGLRDAAPSDWRGYALLRAATWIGITEPPPARDGRTELMPPPAMRLDEFQALRAAANWPDLVAAVERFCSGSGVFWLDGQRLSAQALAAMGPAYAGCAREVGVGTAACVARLPGLATLSFSDGTPFADAATQAWLAGLAPAAGDGGGPANGEALPWDDALARARADAAGGAPEAAIAALAGAEAGSGRDRFRWRLALARLCLETGAAAIALVLLQDLDTIARRGRLAEWEPGLAAEASLLLHRSLAAPDAQMLFVEDARGRATAAAFAALARADPAAAARLARTRTG